MTPVPSASQWGGREMGAGGPMASCRPLPSGREVSAWGGDGEKEQNGLKRATVVHPEGPCGPPLRMSMVGEAERELGPHWVYSKGGP